MAARAWRYLIYASLLVWVAVPRSVAAPAEEWRIYTYDSSGNVRSIQDPLRRVTDRYVYDTAGRLISATTDGNLQQFSYDAFGNRLTAPAATLCLDDTQCGTPLAFEQTTNHLTSAAGAAYDHAGSVTQLNGGAAHYTYDALGMMTQSVANGGLDQRTYVYTADDERIAVSRSGTTEWTIRHLDGKPLRDFRETSAQGTVWSSDHIWRSGQLLATVNRASDGESTATHHHHLDHLGTPRLITDASGVEVARHSYYPFGPELQIAPPSCRSIRRWTSKPSHVNRSVGTGTHTFQTIRSTRPTRMAVKRCSSRKGGLKTSMQSPTEG